MLAQQIESASNKLIQFLRDLTENLQMISLDQNLLEVFRIRSDYAKQLACLFDMLIHRLLEEFLRTRTVQICVNLDPVQIWRFIQNCIEQLTDLQWQELEIIIRHIRLINKSFYNVLLQFKNAEYLKVDQTRVFNQSLTEELNHLSESLIHLMTNVYLNSSQTNHIQPSEPRDTYLFQGVSPTQFSNNNSNHIPEIKPAMNSNCYPYNPQPSYSSGFEPSYCFQPNPIRCPVVTLPPAGLCSQPMGCGISSKQMKLALPLCFPTPVVYTPEMETLFSSGGIIYARKSGNTWIAENLGTLIETLKDIGENIDMNEHCEILVRKTGDLATRRKRGRRKRFAQQQQQHFNQTKVRGHEAHEQTNYYPQQSDSNVSSNDDG